MNLGEGAEVGSAPDVVTLPSPGTLSMAERDAGAQDPLFLTAVIQGTTRSGRLFDEQPMTGRWTAVEQLVYDPVQPPGTRLSRPGFDSPGVGSPS